MEKWVALIYLAVLSQSVITLEYSDEDEEVDTKASDDERSSVEVRAVFLNCDTEDENVSPDNDAMRFEREELFRHRELKDCSKKLALTVKITSEADSSGDEYLPIEHVFEGSNKKRVRLLDPYILRLRRDSPLQAYKLRRLETVCGVLTNTDDKSFIKGYEESVKLSQSRNQRDIEYFSEINDASKPMKPEYRSPKSYQISLDANQLESASLSTTEFLLQEQKDCDSKRVCPSNNNSIHKRDKRNEHNIVVETETEDSAKWVTKDRQYRLSERDNRDRKKVVQIHDNSIHKPTKSNYNKKETGDEKPAFFKNAQKRIFRNNIKMRPTESKGDSTKSEDDEFDEERNTSDHINGSRDRTTSGNKNHKRQRQSSFDNHIYEVNEKDYAVYEVGPPELWYTVQVQLFEKLSTPEGKTVWNDLTKGDLASVSSVSPEWTGQDLNVRYRSTKWMPRDEFALPNTRLCLLVPIKDEQMDSFADNSSSYYQGADFGGTGSVVVPEEDIIALNDEDITIPNDNISESELSTNPSESTEQKHRRVVVRTTRAIMTRSEDKLNIASQGNEKYLTLLHRRPHHAQIDLEARADENELVRVGATGRISIAVADSTRRTRTVLNLQVGNTGLAASRYRVVARDFNPVLTDLAKNKDATIAGPILIPPRHTRSLRLELPVEIPVDVVHCSVSLLNDNDQSVAVRDVSIKKGDRCFCVWHCDCVCLSDDPKLMCRDMDEVRQKAAGLSTRDRSRHTRSAYYPDCATLNIFTIFSGVLLTLLMFGLFKAIAGLMCRRVATWGLHLLLQTPRKLDRYYEPSLCCRKVEYDKDGWPVHPDTMKRTVHLVSPHMEFILNTIFFVCVPCLILYDLVKPLFNKCQSKQCLAACGAPQKIYSKKSFSAQDMQDLALRLRRHRDSLRRWMSPQAQKLSSELWQNSFNVRSAFKSNFMQTLLRENRPLDGASNVTGDSCPDSEQDDTDYVLTQMQKSRESLARSQKKMIDHDTAAIQTTTKEHIENK